jgi:hypothetical protein
MAALHDLTNTADYSRALEQGAPFTLALSLNDGTNPISLTGKGLKAQIRDFPGGSLLGEFTPVILSAAGGTAQLNLSATQTAALPITSENSFLYYDVFLTQTGSDPVKLLFGSIEVIGRITIVT